MVPPADRVLELSRIVDAPRPLVFRAWTAAEHLALWWGPQGFVTIALTADIRVGGAYRATMRSPTGSLHTRRGIYRDLVAPERLVFTYAWEDAQGALGPETVVTLTFAELGERTRIDLRQEVFETASACTAHREGWTSCLARFADYAATLREETTP